MMQIQLHINCIFSPNAIALLGTHRIDDAARSLLRFADRVDTDRFGEPSALAVIVHDGYGYTRPDGVAVIPICALGP